MPTNDLGHQKVYYIGITSLFGAFITNEAQVRLLLTQKLMMFVSAAASGDGSTGWVILANNAPARTTAGQYPIRLSRSLHISFKLASQTALIGHYQAVSQCEPEVFPRVV